MNMMSKPIKLSKKKDGNGYISSYSINISKNEATELGFLDNAELTKIIDTVNKQIIIKKRP